MGLLSSRTRAARATAYASGTVADHLDSAMTTESSSEARSLERSLRIRKKSTITAKGSVTNDVGPMMAGHTPTTMHREQL